MIPVKREGNIEPASLNPEAPSFKSTSQQPQHSINVKLNSDMQNKESFGTTNQNLHLLSDQTTPNQEFLKVQQKHVDISEMIMNQQLRSTLPSHKPPLFSGEAMEYTAFITAFETLIESKVEDSSERLYFLDQYTTGKAKEVIKGCLQMKSSNSYSEAKSLLKKHFGDPFKVANAHIIRLTSWSLVKPKDGQALRDFSIALEQAKHAMTGMSYMNDLNTAHVMRQLWEKLLIYLRS